LDASDLPELLLRSGGGCLMTVRSICRPP
jgi:hypothetical protein